MHIIIKSINFLTEHSLGVTEVLPRQILEILIILLERKDERLLFLSVSPNDDPETRLGFLKLTQALFCNCKCSSIRYTTYMC